MSINLSTVIRYTVCSGVWCDFIFILTAPPWKLLLFLAMLAACLLGLHCRSVSRPVQHSVLTSVGWIAMNLYRPSWCQIEGWVPGWNLWVWVKYFGLIAIKCVKDIHDLRLIFFLIFKPFTCCHHKALVQHLMQQLAVVSVTLVTCCPSMYFKNCCHSYILRL